MDITITRCPYCGSIRIDRPQPLLTSGAEEMAALGIQVPMIQQCQDCKATLNPSAFVVGSPDYSAAYAAKRRIS